MKSIFKGLGIIAAVLTAMTPGCGSGGVGGGISGRYGSLEFTATTPNSTFRMGEAVPYSFSVRNTGASDVIIGYGYDPDGTKFDHLRVYDGDRLIFGGPHSTPSAGTGMTLRPGEERSTSHSWDQRDDNGQVVSAGVYMLIVSLAAGRVGEQVFISPSDTLAAKPIRIVIQ